jgi:hypothetical protein
MRTITALCVLSVAGSAWASPSAAGASPELAGLQAGSAASKNVKVPAQASAAPRPHLLLVLGDDLGFYDTRAEPMPGPSVIFRQAAFDAD